MNPFILSALILQEGRKQTFDPTPYVNFTIVLTIVAVLALILLIPRIYRRILDRESGDKNLNKFLLNDPATRDLLLKKRLGKTGAGTTAATPAAKPQQKPENPDTSRMPVPPVKPVPQPETTKPVPPPETTDPDDAFLDLGLPPKPKK